MKDCALVLHSHTSNKEERTVMALFTQHHSISVSVWQLYNRDEANISNRLLLCEKIRTCLRTIRTWPCISWEQSSSAVHTDVTAVLLVQTSLARSRDSIPACSLSSNTLLANTQLAVISDGCSSSTAFRIAAPLQVNLPVRFIWRSHFFTRPI